MKRLGLVLIFSFAALLGQGSQEARYEIAYATYFGGSEWEQAREVIVYSDGSVLIGGQTSSSNMPTTVDAFQARYAGDDPNLGHGGVYGGDCYFAKLSPDGTEILAATYFGGSKQERNVYGMELDHAGNVVFTSSTRSTDVPTTDGCFQPRTEGGNVGCFVAKLSSELNELRWATYVGGTAGESPRGGLALDAEDNVCIFGTTSSSDFPTTPSAHSRRLNGSRDAFVAKLSADGSGLLWSTLFGGSNDDFMLGGRVDAAGDVIFAGHTTSSDLATTTTAAQPKLGGQHDAYLAKLSGDGARLLFVTYVGGRGNEFPEHRPYVCSDGSSLLPGVTLSEDFYTTPGVFQSKLKGKNDAFLTKISVDGGHFVFSTFLGGSATEVSLMPVLDAQDRILIVGQTESLDLPVTANALQLKHGGGKSDGFLAVLAPDASELLYCTYLGGGGEDMIRSIAIAPGGAIYLVGNTASENFPITPGAAQREYSGKGDAFVVKLVANW